MNGYAHHRPGSYGGSPNGVAGTNQNRSSATGYTSSCESQYIETKVAICLTCESDLVFSADCFAPRRAGKKIPESTNTTPITTISSMIEKPRGSEEE